MLLLALLGSIPSDAADLRVLVLGNSYIFQQDVDQRLDPLLEAAVPGWSQVEVQSLTSGGMTLADHLALAREEGSAWWQALSSGEERWDYVVIQDQSQIPGFSQDNEYWLASRDAAVELAALATAQGAQTVLLLTWGREEGDSTNPGLYPDFETMQALLTDGYLAYAQAVAAAGYVVSVAPAGPAFGVIHDSDPELFAELYHYDGNHPSPWGGTLAALAIAGTIGGYELAGTATPADIPSEDFAALVAAAEAVTVDQPFGELPLSWAHESWQGEVAGSGARPTVKATSGEALVIGSSGGGRWWVDSAVTRSSLSLGEQGWLRWAEPVLVRVDGPVELAGSLEAPECTGSQDVALLAAGAGIGAEALPQGLVLDSGATTLAMDCDGDGSTAPVLDLDTGQTGDGADDGGSETKGKASGCGCGTGSAVGGLWLGMLGLLRRRPVADARR